MSSTQLWNNIVAYALQIGLLVGIGALAPPLLRLRTPRARLLFWQALLVACLALPWVQPWRQEVITISQVSPAMPAPAMPADEPLVSNTVSTEVRMPRRAIPFTLITLYLLAAGVAIRLIWLGVGLARLAGYRRRGHTLDSDPVFSIATAASARWLLSDEIPGPVTFGWRDPVVLLPARFPLLRADLREAILCHELIHVERHDWFFTFAEEIVRAVFWFHPAVWWVLGEIQLAREQTVDQSVVEITHARGHYVDALLAMAGAASGNKIDLAPAPLFLRKRHFKKRVTDLLQEARITRFSKARLALSQVIAMATIAGVGWTVSGAFPLAAAPQRVTDATGVMVNTGGAKLLFRTPVAYPDEAIVRGVQGRVVVQAAIDADGQLGDETVVSCLRELCQAALDSLPAWQFDSREANTTHAFNIDFVNPVYAQVSMPPAPGIDMSRARTTTAGQNLPTFQSRTAWSDGQYVDALPATIASAVGRPLSDIRITGLSGTASNQLRSRIPLQAGDIWSAATSSLVKQIVNDFDPHLEVNLVNHIGRQQWSLWIGPPVTSRQSPITQPSVPPSVYLAGNGIAPPTVLNKVDPAYTDGAKSAGISGTLMVSMVVGSDGTAQNIQVTSPLDPGLDRSATEALAKWRFRPGTKDGEPVSIQTQVIFTFRLL